MKCLWFIFFAPLGLFAQQPSHYILGQQELEGIDIYGIHHGSDLNYYLATSRGLIVYDGYDFLPVSCDGTLTNSVFNVVEDHTGAFYFNNLGGQIFKSTGTNCELFYSLPDSLTSADIGLEVDNQNRLVVRANGIMFFDSTAQIEDYTHLGYSGYPARMDDKSLWIYSKKDECFAVFKDDEISLNPKFKDEGVETPIYNVLQFGEGRYRYLLNSCKLFEIGHGGKLLIDPEEITKGQGSNRIYATSKSIWLAPNLAGIYQFDNNLNLVNKAEPFFPNTLISAVCEDAEGNILLGTFGAGVIVIPNENALDFSLPDAEESVISIDRTPDGVLYFGTLSGKIYEKNHGDVRLLREGESKRMESLFANEKDLVIGDYNGAIIDRSTGTERKLKVGSIKDVAYKGSDSILVGSNMGAFWVNRNSGEGSFVKELVFRHFCIGYNSNTNAIYSGTAKGLAIASNGQAPKFIRYKGKPIGARSIDSYNDLMFVATSNNGVLVFRSDSILENWSTSSGLVSNSVYQLQVSDNKVLLSTEEGIQILSLEGESLYIVKSSDGLATERVTDFEFFENELWAVHSKGVQIIDLKNLSVEDFNPKLEIRSITVNDTIGVHFSQSKFDADQQKFAIDLKVSTLRHQKEISYQYRLEGAETEWQTSSYRDHIIQYQSLAPGDYTFRAKAITDNTESEEVTYSFTIATPYYMAWWFYALISVGLILLVILWFRGRLNRQEFIARQQNELNASKLTAIQSQMNPHFIFNALNSIQDLVLKGDVSNSYTYITKFADLVRRTLNYSDKDFIDFENELKLIELYLTLEKLRFKEDFDFNINAKGIEDIQLPPMLIQPFIENALVHGLLHREGAKRLELSFELNDNLICTITDNGVGRKKSQEIKDRQRSSHESFSVNAIRRRFEILERNFGGDLGFKTEDLMEDGIATGTRVTLSIPVKRKF